MSEDGHRTSQECAAIEHCVSKIRRLIAEGRDDRRAVLQMGYNLGRLSELTGMGRGPFWDDWKDAVDAWDRARLDALARELLNKSVDRPEPRESPDAPESGPP